TQLVPSRSLLETPFGALAHAGTRVGVILAQRLYARLRNCAWELRCRPPPLGRRLRERWRSGGGGGNGRSWYQSLCGGERRLLPSPPPRDGGLVDALRLQMWIHSLPALPPLV